MLIYVVQPGDTIYTISETYGVSAEKVILDNELSNPDNLVPGQTIIILFPKETYTVKEGDSLQSIAKAYGVSQIELLKNNPQLADGEYLYVGETLVIENSTDKKRNITTNGYAYPFINHTVLKKTLPFLTYLTIYSYRITPEGDLIQIDDCELIRLAKQYGVAPLMLLTTFSGPGNDSIEATHTILNHPDRQNHLIDNILKNMKKKGYYGLNIDSNSMNQEDCKLFADFVTNVTKRVNQEGFKVVVTFTPEALEEFHETVCDENNFEVINRVANDILILSYGWGYTFGRSISAAPINMVRKVVSKLPHEKISIGIPGIGYDWEVPGGKCSPKSRYLSYHSAIELAVDVKAAIKFDEITQTPYFQYSVINRDIPSQHIVWFRDARSIEAMLKLIPEYNFKGIGVLNIMNYFPLMWLSINNAFHIEKV